MTGSNARYVLARHGRCPDCDGEYQRLAKHWGGSCDPPQLTSEQHMLVAGLLLGNGFVGRSGGNKYFQISTRWRPFAHWIFAELGWLASTLVRQEFEDESHSLPAQRYIVQTHAHPGLTRFRTWYNDGKHRHPTPTDLPGGRLTPRMGRVWHASAGNLTWSNPEYKWTRQISFSAHDDDRAARIVQLLESVGLEPTVAGQRVQLPPKQVTGWLEWIGPPVEGVEYKWTASHPEYREVKRDAEELRARLWYHPAEEELVTAVLDGRGEEP